VTEEHLAQLADRDLVALLDDATPCPSLLRRELLRRLGERGAGRAARPSLRCSAEAWEAFGRRMGGGTRERFWVVAVDARNRPLRRYLAALGTLDHCVVHPRDVFAPLIRSRAAACILVHNHPSGDPTPSPEDETLTARLVECGRILGVPVLDHLVVTREAFTSLRDLGKLAAGAASG
jgi:DNA repair protein RadC